MGIYSVWPFFACMAGLLVLAAGWPLRIADAPANTRSQRIATIHGLRGFLALGVFFHHAAMYYRLQAEGRWQPTPSAFYNELGQVSVALFFVITGYLFWARLVSENGRLNWLRFFIGRLFRLGPLYLLAVSIMIMIVFTRTHFQLNRPWFVLIQSCLEWMMLGTMPQQDINGYQNTAVLVASAPWTLQYEWLFYLSLPISALMVRRRGVHIIFSGLLLILCFFYVWLYIRPEVLASAPVCALLFSIGMTCASIEACGMSVRLPDAVSSTAVILLLFGTFIGFDNANQAVPIAMLGLAFHLIVSGSSVFGLLVGRPAKLLGDISYGLYLLQGLVLAMLFSVEPLRQYALASPARYWQMAMLCAVLLVVAACIAHVWVERTGIDFGRRFANDLEAWLERQDGRRAAVSADLIDAAAPSRLTVAVRSG